ncbi:MAG: ABC transporter substrate-binding protein [Clostridiales Family XIII bacterium]|jgi:peptide/nickel transport system substrate-binding protein|nr:ABC transporter substrate-binding protein [Clostridiales Family XIII bacterium]
MKMNWKSMALVCMLVVMMVFTSACGSSSEKGGGGGTPGGGDTGESPDKTLTVGTLDAADTFDPTVNSSSGLGLSLVYDTILYRDPESGEIKSDLAETWEFSDPTTVVLNIREGIKFSNGDDLTPEDVMFSMQRFTTVNTQFDPGYANIDYDKSTIEGNKITLKLIEPNPDFLLGLCNDRWACVVDKKYVESTEAEAFWDKPVGTGAYTCVENVAGSHATFAKKSDYWGTAPESETITINYYPELTTMMVDYENNVLDIALDIGESEYNNAENGSYADTEIKILPAYDILSVALPQYMECFKDIKVRRAVAMALDVEAINKAVYGTLGTTADSILIKGIEFYKSIGINKYDPEQAKKLLAEAGYSENELELLMLFPSMPTNDKASAIVQAQLAEIGIKLNVDSGDFATVIPRLMNNECELAISGTGGGTYFASTIFSLIDKSSTNASIRINDDEFNKLVEEGNTSLDTAVRAEAYGKAQQWMYDNYWNIPISYPNTATLYHSNVDNVKGIAARAMDLKFVTFK